MAQFVLILKVEVCLFAKAWSHSKLFIVACWKLESLVLVWHTHDVRWFNEGLIEQTSWITPPINWRWMSVRKKPPICLYIVLGWKSYRLIAWSFTAYEQLSMTFPLWHHILGLFYSVQHWKTGSSMGTSLPYFIQNTKFYYDKVWKLLPKAGGNQNSWYGEWVDNTRIYFPPCPSCYLI